MSHWLKLGGLIVGASILSACVAGSAEDFDENAETATESLVGRPGAVTNKSSAKCLTSPALAASAEGASIVQSSCLGNGTFGQQWDFRLRSDGFYDIVGGSSNLCLGIAGASTEEGARLIQWKCDDSDEQGFRADASLSTTQITNKLSGKCLALSSPSTADGIRIIQWRCQDTTAQKWTHK